MAKNKTGLYAGIAAAVVVVAIVAGVIIANGNKSGNGNGDSNDGSSQASGLTTADFAKVDETINYGKYDDMEILSKSIQNGEMVGKVVKIDGLVSRPGTTYNIVQENEDGTKKIGTKFVIEGVDTADYPKDGTRVVITGKIVEETPMVYVIKTIPDMIETE